MLMLRKAELMMVLAAGSNVRIRTEHGGRFTSTRALPYISHTYMYLRPTLYTLTFTHVCSAVLYIHKYTQQRVHVLTAVLCIYVYTRMLCHTKHIYTYTYKYKHTCCAICINTYNHTCKFPFIFPCTAIHDTRAIAANT